MKTTIYNQHYEHTQWLNKLAFYKDEISVMQNRIDEIVKKNNSKEVQMQVEHFQNQLLIQQNNADNLKHQIKHDEKALTNEIKQNQTAIDHRKKEDHAKEREDVEIFETNFNKLRKEFNSFVAKWM